MHFEGCFRARCADCSRQALPLAQNPPAHNETGNECIFPLYVSAGSLCCYLLNEIRYSAPKSSRPPSRRNNFRTVSAREGRVHLAGKCDVVERERGIPHLVNGQIDALRCVCSQREGANQTSVTSPKILCCSFNVLNGWKWKECTFGMRKLGKTTECYQSCIAFNLFEQNGNFIAENHFLHCLLFRK